MAVLPLRAALALGAALGRLGWALSPRLRREMRASLEVAFPEKPLRERDDIARASLVHLGMVAGELVAMNRWVARYEEYAEVSPETLALLARMREEGRGSIFVMGHIGNWELVSRLSPYVQPCGAIAKRSWHPRIDAMFVRLRAENGVGTLFREDTATARQMLKLLKDGGTLGILIDQDTSVQSVFVPFFGRLAATPRAAADLALRFGAKVLVITSHRRGPRPGDGHRMEIVEVPYDAAATDREAEAIRITAACVAAQEQAIRRHPAEWVWMHQRWKTRPER
jgi:KDO2-lipid IV(A) lauroyltransferase